MGEHVSKTHPSFFRAVPQTKRGYMDKIMWSKVSSQWTKPPLCLTSWYSCWRLHSCEFGLLYHSRIKCWTTSLV